MCNIYYDISCVWKRTYVWSSYFINCFYHVKIGSAPRKKRLCERIHTNVYLDGDNADFYVEIYLTVVNGFYPLIINKKRSTHLWIIRKNFSIALFRATCIFKYFNFVEISNLETVTNKFFDGLECHFYVENLKLPLFCNTFICKLNVFCSPRLKLYCKFIMSGTCSRKKRTKGLKILG